MELETRSRSNELERFVKELFPVCRSITGDGIRATFNRMSEEVPLRIREIPSGTKVFDWSVPDEWNIDGAFVEAPDGSRIVDFADNNLHVMSYSAPVDGTFPLAELREHLYTIPEKPDLIPYRTSYYQQKWGICLAHRQYVSLADGDYRVKIDSRLEPGSLSLGELYIPGHSDEEILVWSHACHPSLCNDNLSGLAVTIWWAKALLEARRQRYSYRFVWGPGTIGSIAWLALNKDRLSKVRGGLVTVLLGRPGEFHYKRTRQGGSVIDRTVERILRSQFPNSVIRDFDPYGYDERQFGSPGINLPIGRISRVPNGEYPEYHTSADNLDIVSGDTMAEALQLVLQISSELENAEVYCNIEPYCEPQLGKRGLYRQTGGEDVASRELSILWVLNQSDGIRSLQDIADQSGLKVDALRRVAEELSEAGLLEKK